MVTRASTSHPQSRCVAAGALLGAALCVTLVSPAARAEYANPHGVAVIIGNRSYENERVPEVSYAHRDADAFRRFVLEVLGFSPDNLIDLRDASQAQMETVFGNERSHQGRVWRYLNPTHGSEVVVFYSGHGVPGLKDGRGYLLPVDADPDSAEINGYPIDLLYANLGKLEDATSVQVFLDACFSGGSDQGMLVRAASPVFVQAALPETSGDKLTVLAAASGKEVASWDEEAQHGLFTRHLMDALYGAGDRDGDGQVTALEAKTYLDDTMTLAARREFGRLQNASLNGVTEAVLVSAGADGTFRTRPSLDGEEVATVAVVDEEVAAAAQEDALSMTRAQRVLVQRGLASLGLDVGPADGLFGRRTRAAIAAYQKEKEFAETGHLDSELAEALRALGEEATRTLADAKNKERENLAEQEELQRLAAEREFWASVKTSEDPSRFAEYLEAYPNGMYVSMAHQIRDTLLTESDDAAFASAQALGTKESYAKYLKEHPEGRHVDDARKRQLALLTQDESTLEKEVESSTSERRPGDKYRDCEVCPEMVIVPLTPNPIAVGRFEVTFSEWDACRRTGGCSHQAVDWNWGRDSRPVIDVSWNDAQEYVRWLSKKTGKTYRLLEETEWEFVTPDARNRLEYPYVRIKTSPVGSSAPNMYGLFDTDSNVWEWSDTCWHSDDEVGSTSCSHYVLRGGIQLLPYGSAQHLGRAPKRNKGRPQERHHDVGFRVATTLD